MIQIEGQRTRVRAACGCLARSEVPSLPTSVPEQAKHYSREELEHWIKSCYAASAFNIVGTPANAVATPLETGCVEGALERL